MPTFTTPLLAPFFTLAITLFALSGQAATVNVFNNAFSPSSVQINVGESVTWVNQDELNFHYIVSDNNAFPPFLLETEESVTIPFNTPGTYNYSEGIDEFFGTITVIDPSTNPPVPILALSSPSFDGTNLQFDVATQAGHAYTLEVSIDPTFDATWEPVALFPGATNLVHFSQPVGTNTYQFYRVRDRTLSKSN